jgi:hypothetical protein
MIIYPAEVHADLNRARFGVESAAKMLEINVDCDFSTQWVIFIDTQDFQAFLELAREVANEK